jgi:hypothetical protein
MGVSSLDLGRSAFGRPFFIWQLLPVAVESANAQISRQKPDPRFKPYRPAEIAFAGDALHL